MLIKTLSASIKKLVAAFGGAPMLPAVYAAVALCFFACSAIVTATAPEKAVVAVFDGCGGELSRELVRSISSAEGITAVTVSCPEAGEDELLKGRAEVLISISPEYDELLSGEGAAKLVSLSTAPGAVSAELIRETLSGLLIAQRSALRAAAQLEAEGFDASEMQKYMDEFEISHLYSTSVTGGAGAQKAVFGTAYACYEGVAGLLILLLLLTLSRRLADPASRLVAYRLASAENGRGIAFLSDLAALMLAGLIASAAAFAFAPSRSFAFALGLFCFCLCVSGLCVLITRRGSSARLDIAAPFIALATSVIGGCFADLGMLSPALKIAARLTPQGQLTAAARGAYAFAALLGAEGVLLSCAAWLLHRKKA